MLGIPDAVIEHGEQHELHHECGFDQEGIELAVMQLLEFSSKTA
jgi:1-deoxy-D-xylulose-5-phosphate synthase